MALCVILITIYNPPYYLQIVLMVMQITLIPAAVLGLLAYLLGISANEYREEK